MTNCANNIYLSDLPLDQACKKSQVLISGNYQLKSLREKKTDYAIYKGRDAVNQKQVNIYAKLSKNDFKMSNPVKQSFRKNLCPNVLWSGQEKVGKTTYFFQAHQRYGPSLRTMFERIQVELTQKQFLHLFYQIIKLIEKINNAKLVCGQLDPDFIIFNNDPKNNELFILNSFSLKKPQSQPQPMYSKYCSIGMHSGKKIGIKDDMESLCYILIDLYLKGDFLKDKLPFQYKVQKMAQNPSFLKKKMPKIFTDFYSYVRDLNQHKEPRFTYWKNLLIKSIGPEILSSPYSFTITRSRKHIGRHSKVQQINIQAITSNADDDQEEETELGEQFDSDKQVRMKKMARMIVPKRITDLGLSICLE